MRFGQTSNTFRVNWVWSDLNQNPSMWQSSVQISGGFDPSMWAQFDSNVERKNGETQLKWSSNSNTWTGPVPKCLNKFIQDQSGATSQSAP